MNRYILQKNDMTFFNDPDLADPPASALRVRAMNAADSAGVAALMPHLGYPSTEADIAARLQALLAWPDNAVFVAEQEGKIAGLCQIHGVRLIASNGYAEIAALVVHSDCHRRGIGTRLLEQALSWAQDRRYERVRLRSGVQREPAHRFYENRGFLRQRASYAFELTLPQNESASLPVMPRASGA